MRAILLAAAVALGCGSQAPSSGAAGDAGFAAQPLETVTSDSGRLVAQVWTAPDQPPSRGVVRVQLAITDASSGAAVDELAIDAVPWMPAHGHGASVVPTVSAQGGGRYVVDGVDFYMPGHWELRIAISGAATDHVTPAFDIP